MTSEAITTRLNQVSKAMDTTMPPAPLPISSPPSSPSTPSSPPSLCHLPQFSQLSSHCCAFPINWCITPAQHQREKPHMAQPQQQRAHSSKIPLDVQAKIHVEHGPSKKSYVSIAALDLTEDTSLPLNPHLHHLLLTELGITDIQACKAALSDPDTLTYDQVLFDPDIEEWKKSTHKEVTQLESKDTWVEVPTSEATSKILPGTWVFHCKRAPTRFITKFKARYCVRGDLQEDIPETYAPVVSWSTIRLVLVFTLTQKWHLICVDFNNAFVQADLKDPVWIHLSRGYKSKSTTPMCL